MNLNKTQSYNVKQRGINNLRNKPVILTCFYFISPYQGL